MRNHGGVLRQGMICFAMVLGTLNLWGSVGAVSTATANTGAVAVEASEVAFMNPASLGFIKGYYFTAGYGSTQQVGSENVQSLSLSLTDAMPQTVVPSALGYSQNSQKIETDQGESTWTSKSFKLGFGNQFMKQVSFGLGINYQNDKNQTESFNQTNLDTGLLWVVNSNLGLAIWGQNLLPSPKEMPESWRLDSKTTLAGVFNYRKFMRIKADLTTGDGQNWSLPRIGVGLESYLNQWLVLRWGIGKDMYSKTDSYSAGVGFMGPRFSFSYAFQNSPQNDRFARHLVDLAVPIW